ncbi:hypothetical protein A3Q56_03345 [Intoshia linei]|uniref:t-SNARE coiled-coil homology domain-containing protein n=1 Tax=Intoshia linei TaxID=1819745 RepID=A0A177B3M3_9BILA|nr:hypothetical protein A3Q56_03345 [Intoshia linei]
MLDKKNRDDMQALNERVGILKEIAFDIDQETVHHNRILDSMVIYVDLNG